MIYSGIRTSCRPIRSILYIELSNSFLIGRKRTVNFRNQRPWPYNCRLYNNHVKESRTLKVTENHIKLALFGLLPGSEKGKHDFHFFAQSGVHPLSIVTHIPRFAISIAHVRYINILTWLRGFRIKIASCWSFFFPSIPKKDLDTKKATLNMEVCSENLGAMSEYWYLVNSQLRLLRF